MIRVLSKSVADKIAAGEVVDRPLSVVKELVENSIDAGAKAITVEIKKGGKEYIRVTDDGCGIPADEAETAFLRHATSKIAEAEDLTRIKTLGFRGEALASIAAVSRTELLTKTAEAKTGILLRIEGGETVDIKATGCPDGTTVTVSDLFFNTPARLKFMKSDNTESALITDFLSKTVLAYPNIKFRVINNGNILFSTNGGGDIYRNILTVYSSDMGRELVKVEKEGDGGSVMGYVSNPSFSKSSRKNQVFFVNGRYVHSKVIERGINEAYAERLFDGRFPAAFLFVNIPPENLDVNIHPNKLEIRFDDEREVVALVRSAVAEALSAREAVPQLRSERLFGFSGKKEAADPVPPPKREEPQDTQQIIEVKEPSVNIKNLLSTLRKEQDAQLHMAEEQTELKTTPANKAFEFERLKLLGIAFDTYILATLGDALYLFDQHAAHERVFFEKLRKQYLSSEKLLQPLLTPLLIHVSSAEKSNEEQWLSELRKMAFDIDDFGPKAYSVRAIPMFMELSEAEDFLNDFIENAGESKDLLDKSRTEKLAAAACKKAVKAHDRLSPDEAQALIHQLADCENPYSCPHGRPTFVRLTKHEIEKLFKRV